MPRTIKKARNQALHPIAARWVAPGELFVGSNEFKEDSFKTLSLDEERLLKLFRKLNNEGQIIAIENIDTLVQSCKYDNGKKDKLNA